MIFRRKSGAIELSMTTIIVVVLSLTLLILGFVFVRSIMCGAIGFTEEINSKVNREIQNLFETSGSEIVCIGSQEPKTMVPGIDNHIFCSINAKEQGNKYSVTFKSIESSGGIPQTEAVKWVTRKSWEENDFPPNDKTARKTITVSIPEDASEGNIRVNIEASKITADGSLKTLTGSKNLDFRITRSGVVRNVLC